MHEPYTINKFETGLVQSQPGQVLAQDAFVNCTNAITFRNTAQRRHGVRKIGRLRRLIEDLDIGVSEENTWDFNIFDKLGVTDEPYKQIEIGSLEIVINDTSPITYEDDGLGVLTSTTPGIRGPLII